MHHDVQNASSSDALQYVHDRRYALRIRRRHLNKVNRKREELLATLGRVE
jgi:hypothetical protein